MKQPGVRELRAFSGFAMASAAMSIDLILPAFGEIRDAYGLPSDSARTAGLISAFFLGNAIGPIPFGLLADRVGRKRTLLASLGVFSLGAALATVMPSLGLIMVARFIWGFGAAGIRTAVTASIRDRSVGEAMAKELSFAMAIFITVPIVAPFLGQGLLQVFPWRVNFAFCLLFGIAIGLWALRIPETLAVESRQPMQARQIGRAVMAICRNRAAASYGLATACLFGAFASYLASSERILEVVFHKSSWFPFVFGGTAVVMGLTSIVVGRSVGRIGLPRLLRGTSVVYLSATVGLWILSRSTGGIPSIWPFLVLLAIVLASHNVLFSNLTAAAMAPVGHVAGTAGAVLATAATAMGAVVGAVIDGAFDGTISPFALGFVTSGAVLIGLVVLAQTGSRSTVTA